MPRTTADHLVADARSRIRQLTVAEVEAHVLGGRTRIVDVREPEELDEHGLIAGAFHVPRGVVEFWADPSSRMHRRELQPDQPTILYSGTGGRSALAAWCLCQLGYVDVAHLDGGLTAWAGAGLPVVGLKTWHVHSTPRRT